jgi:hypothetical protein
MFAVIADRTVRELLNFHPPERAYAFKPSIPIVASQVFDESTLPPKKVL